jgi:hypothetical protein
VEATLSALIGLLLGLVLGRTALGRRGHDLVARVVARGAAYALREPLARTPAGWAMACVGLAGAAGAGAAVLLWGAALTAALTPLHLAPALCTALIIAVAAGSRDLWPLRDASGDPARPALSHWLIILFFYGLIGPIGALAGEVLLLAASAGEPAAAGSGVRALLAVLTYVPRRVSDMVAVGLAIDRSPAGESWWRQVAAIAWGIALAAGLATIFHLSGRHSEAYFKNWEDLAYLQRIAELTRSWQHGVIYPRIYPTFAWGFGYPLPNFYPPAVFFMGAAFHQAGLGVAPAMNAALWVILFLGALGVFLLCNALAGPIFATLAAVLAGAAVTGVPTIIYGTGGVAHAFGLAWTPFVLLGLRRCYRRPTLASGLLLGLAVAAEALVHNISMALVMALIALYAVVRGVRDPGTRWAAAGVVMGLGLAAFFWLPALAERNCILSQRLYEYWVLPWWTLIRLDPWWTALRAGNLAGAQDQVPFIGRSLYLLHTRLPLIVWGLGVMLLLAGYQGASDERRPARDELFLWAALFVLSYFTMTESAWAWGKGSPLRLVQGPVRIVPWVAVIGPALAAVAMRELWGRMRSQQPLDLRAAILWLAVYGTAGIIVFRRIAPDLLPKACLALGAPLAVAVAAHLLKRARAPRLAAAVVIMVVGLALLAARDRLEDLGRIYRPIPAPASTFTPSGYLRWERATTSQIVGTNVGEYLPRWTQGREPKACRPHALVGVGCEVIARRPGWLKATFAVRAPRPAECLYGALYYPGWTVSCDGRRVTCRPSREGLVSFIAPAGTATVEVQFGETPLRKVADILSLASLCVMAGMMIAVLAARPRSA